MSQEPPRDTLSCHGREHHAPRPPRTVPVDTARFLRHLPLHGRVDVDEEKRTAFTTETQRARRMT